MSFNILSVIHLALLRSLILAAMFCAMRSALAAATAAASSAYSSHVTSSAPTAGRHVIGRRLKQGQFGTQTCTTDAPEER
jgi:hypothetical protein